MKIAAMHIEIMLKPPEEGRTEATAGEPNVNVAVDADAGAFRTMFLESFSK